jgi:hypothetical protein
MLLILTDVITGQQYTSYKCGILVGVLAFCPTFMYYLPMSICELTHRSAVSLDSRLLHIPQANCCPHKID